MVYLRTGYMLPKESSIDELLPHLSTTTRGAGVAEDDEGDLLWLVVICVKKKRERNNSSEGSCITDGC